MGIIEGLDLSGWVLGAAMTARSRFSLVVVIGNGWGKIDKRWVTLL
jgi:hypothetical protein